MYSAKELEHFNSVMVGRGVPNVEDGVGYNKPDWMVCNNYYDGLSNSELADLAERLVKYKRQLNIDTDKMRATAEYYKNLITVIIGEKETMVNFKFNNNFKNVISEYTKKARRFDWTEKAWFVHNNNIMEVLDNLEKVGADVAEAKKLVSENIVTVVEPKQEQNVNNKNVLTVKEAMGAKLEIAFMFDAKMVETVKTLKHRRFNGKPSNTWTIYKDAVNELIELIKLNQVEIDYSELEKFIPKDEPNLKLKDFSYLKAITPFTHQFEAGQFLLDKKKAILADEMGGGKTLSAILAGESINGKKLIIPPSTLKLNWRKEINMIYKDLDTKVEIKVIDGSKWQDCKGWTIINYDILDKHIDNILKAGFKVVIIDEAHYIKAINNSGKPSSIRAEKVLNICDNIDYCFLLTGTPIKNKTKDIFNLLKAINHPLSQRFVPFAKKFCGAFHNGWGWDFNGSSNQEELNVALQPFMMRRLKQDLLDLPEKIRTFIPVEIDARGYNNKVKEYMSERESLSGNGEHLVYLNALRHMLAKEKVKHTMALVDDLLEQDEQVVVFTCYKFVVDELKKKFEKVGVGTITGSDSNIEVDEAKNQFQAGKLRLMICNIQAGGVGHTLTSSKNLIFNDFDWIPANHAQAEDRIHRIGQNNNVNIYYIYATNAEMDETMALLLEKKLKNISQIVDGKEDSFLNEFIEMFGLRNVA